MKACAFAELPSRLVYSFEMLEELINSGKELREIEFDGFWDWFIQSGNLETFGRLQPTYIIAQFAFLLGGLCTFFHGIDYDSFLLTATQLRGRAWYLWLGIIIHGLVVEMASYWLPDIDNFWHSQTPIMLLGLRLPLHIMFLYPCFLYQASMAISKLKLPDWAEPFAVGLTVVLIDMPYDITSVKFVHWTWHDTDPNIYDRHYWVPWNSYYFHACFAASFTLWFHGLRRWFGMTKRPEEKWQPNSSCVQELSVTVLAGILGMPGGVLLFLPLYHPLHDIYGIHSEVTFFILAVTFLLIIWSGDRNRITYQPGHSIGYSWILLLHLIVHYAAFLTIVLYFHPENEISIGLHETPGPCHEKARVDTAFGMVLEKRRYLCLKDYDEAYFDFHCVDKIPESGMSWYTICGTPFTNRAEYVAIVATITGAAAVVFTNLHFYAGNEVETKRLIAHTNESSRNKKHK